MGLVAGAGDRLRLDGQLFRNLLTARLDEVGVGGSIVDEVEVEGAELGLSEGVSELCRRWARWIDLDGRGGGRQSSGASMSGAVADGDNPPAHAMS